MKNKRVLTIAGATTLLLSSVFSTPALAHAHLNAA